MRTTIEEKEYHLAPAHRNPRLVRDARAGGGYLVVLDDDGYGEHQAWVSDTEAAELHALGMPYADGERCDTCGQFACECEPTEPVTVTCSVDEHGRASGFEYDGEIESFGTGLEGEEVTLDDGRSGTVSKVYGHIQTGNPGSGTSNYVAVEVTVE